MHAPQIRKFLFPILEFEIAFAAHDHGSEGKIYRRELRALCRSLGHNLTGVELEDIITQLSLTGEPCIVTFFFFVLSNFY